MSADRPTLNSAVLAQFSIFFQLTLQKHLCPPLSSLGLIIVTRSSQAALGHLLEKLGKVQNSAARLVLKTHKRDHVSPLLRTLHWLPIQARIKHKLSTLCHSFFSDTAPVYLCDFLRVYCPSRQLRSSSDSRTLRIPHIRPKHLDSIHFPMLLLLSGILCLMTLDIFSQSLHLKLPWTVEDSSVQILPLLVKPVLPPPLSMNYIIWLAVVCVCMCVCVCAHVHACVHICVCVCVCVWEGEIESERDVGCVCWCTVQGWACYCCFTVLAFLFFCFFFFLFVQRAELWYVLEVHA